VRRGNEATPSIMLDNTIINTLSESFHQVIAISPRLGLLFNFIGTILIAFTVRKNPEEAHSLDKKGRQIYLASIIYPRMFSVGIGMIVIGFFLQLLTVSP